MSDPAIKTKQFKHQEKIYLEHRDDHCYGLYWEMGLGKTKVMLDVASHLFHGGKISGLIIMAPNSVYKNWISQEIPKHLAAQHVMMPYPKSNTERSKLKKRVFLDEAFKADHLKILAISFDSLGTTHGLSFVKMFAGLYDCMAIADESTAIKKHSSKRSKRSKMVRDLVDYRWIATGTPATESPFDVHSQIEFLDEDFWANYGLKTLSAFKNEFGEFALRKLPNGRRFNELQGYRRMNVLQKILATITSRLLKEDSGIELPPKTYSLRTFELMPEQRRLYNEVKYEYEAEIEGGFRVEAALAIVRMQRLQQITSGFVTAEEVVELTDDVEGFEQMKLFEIDKQVRTIVPKESDPKLKLLVDLIEEARHKVIVWSRFRRDIDNICDTLGNRAIRYDGTVKQKDREIAIERFRDPNDAQVLVVNIAAMNQGITLTIAKTMIYYSNHFSLDKRLQSEDRNHRIGQDSPVLIIDIAAENTVDERIIQLLKDKYDIAAQVTGDRFREWIRTNDSDE